MKELTLRLVSKVASVDESWSKSAASSPLLNVSVSALADESTGVYQVASDVLVDWVNADARVANQLFSGEPGMLMKKLLDVNGTASDVVRFRVLELIARVGGSSEDAFKAADKAGLLAPLKSELERDDPLLQMNVLEVLGHLAESPAGASFLYKSGLLKSVEKMLSSTSTMPLLVPGLLKFLGNLVGKSSKGIDAVNHKGTLEQITRRIHGMVLNSGPDAIAAATAAVFALGQICTHPKGMKVIGGGSSSVLNALGDFVAGSNADLREATLHALGMMGMSDGVRAMASEDYERVWRKMDEGTMGKVASASKSPFPETRYAAFHTMQGLTGFGWGVKRLLNHPGMLEYLLDRGTEDTKVGKEWKFAIIQGLIAGPGKKLLDDSVVGQLSLYASHGPFYVATEAQVKVEKRAS